MALTKACPECQKNGHDSKEDHLWLMADGKSWCCQRSEYHEDGKEYYEFIGKREKEKKDEETYEGKQSLVTLLAGSGGSSAIPEGDDDVFTAVDNGSGSTVKNIGEIGEYRSIRADVYKRFKYEGLLDSSGKLTGIQYELLESKTDRFLAYKIRKLPKDFYCSASTGKGTAIQFFGQKTFPRAKRLLITEGELDAMSAYQMLEKYRVACVSLPLGSNVSCLMNNPEYLKGFKEIYVSMDKDDAGKKVARDIANLIPHAKFLEFSEKDANDMLTKGKQVEFVSSFWDAEIYTPDTIVRVSDVMDKVLLKPTMGEPWPWDTLTDKTYGRNPGQGIYVGAGVKIGKSEFINQVVAFDIGRKKKIAVLKYEEPPFMTVKRVAGKLDGIFYHRPGVTYSDIALMATSQTMEEYLLMYPAFGKATWETTKEFIRYAALWGAETVIVDPVTKLTNHLNSSETENELRTLSDELACMAQDMGFFYIVTCHLKAPTTGPPHERGGKVQSYQYRGSRAMMENTYYKMGIERNKDPDLSEKEINTSTFVLLEDRNFGNTAKFPVFYDSTNQGYLEPTGGIF